MLTTTSLASYLARTRVRWAATAALLLLSVGAAADATAPTYADVEFVRATETGPGVWRFDVTVSHPDTGWENYADRWQVRDAASDEPLGERILLHPHVGEQPFTRSLSNMFIPVGVELVSVGARTNLTGFVGTQVEVDLHRQQGDRFDVLRISDRLKEARLQQQSFMDILADRPSEK